MGGSAVRQDGRSASLTAPNGTAQRTLLLAALSRTTLVPAEVALVEAHGTGTALGDPTEAGALVAVHGGATQRATPLGVGAAKASVGHGEAVSGQIGVLRACRLLRDGAAAGNAALRMLNPLVGERLGAGRGARFLLPTQCGGGVREAGGVSSFGYSGTIAHAVLLRGGDADEESALASTAVARPLTYRRRAFPWRAAREQERSALRASPRAPSLHTPQLADRSPQACHGAADELGDVRREVRV